MIFCTVVKITGCKNFLMQLLLLGDLNINWAIGCHFNRTVDNTSECYELSLGQDNVHVSINMRKSISKICASF